jgi:hypothetical protein
MDLDYILSYVAKLNYTKKIKNDIIEYVITKRINPNYEKTRNDTNEKRLDSLQRSARNIRSIIDNNLEFNDLILTLTFKENMQDYNISDIEFQKFIRKLRNKYGDLEYISVKELQERGAIHYHIILFSYGKIINMSERELIETWGLGRCELDYVRPDNYDSLRFYFSKYLTDWQKGDLIKTNRKIYSTSRGVNKIIREKATKVDILKAMKNNNHIIIIKGNHNWFYAKVITNKNM